MRHAEGAGQLVLEGGHLRTEDEPLGGQHPRDRRAQVVAEGEMLRPKVEERNSIHRSLIAILAHALLNRA